MTDTDAKAVQRAVDGLAKGTEAILNRYGKQCLKRPTLTPISKSQRSSIQEILRHMSHCLTVLGQKQKSLQAAIDCTEQDVVPFILRRLSATASGPASEHQRKQRVQLLQHIFQQLVRLRDGLILCVSGECRHEADIRKARTSQKNQRWASHLTQAGSTRDDGYTQLYHADCVYSGASWDEFMDSRNGLQKRLLEALRPFVPASKRETLWEDLMETRGQALEILLDETEIRMQSIQQRLSALDKSLASGIAARLPGASAHLTMADKMEKLEVSIGGSTFKFERRANNFQIQDIHGVLPSSYARKDWKDTMKLPSKADPVNLKAGTDSCAGYNSHKIKRVDKKRRRAIEESDNEGSIHQSTTHDYSIQRSSGLVVKVQQSRENAVEAADQNSTNVSLRDIKQSMGVNVENLAAARDTLEQEESNATRDAAIVDKATTDDIWAEEEQQVTLQTVNNCRQLRIVLRRMLKRRDVDDEDAIWDARECLRESLMLAGNRLLWPVPDGAANKLKRCQELEQARALFVEALSCVAKQEPLLTIIAERQRDYEVDTELYRRTLGLLRGKAQTNAGIALIEQSKCESDSNRKLCVRNAIKDLELAVESTNALVSSNAINYDCHSRELLLDILQGLNLRALALRWMASALWYQERQTEAARVFQQAGSMWQKWSERKMTFRIDEELTKAESELYTECYSSWMTLADLACSDLESIPIHPTRVTLIDKNDYLFGFVVKSFEEAIILSNDIHRTAHTGMDNTTKSGDLCEIKGKEELTIGLEEIRLWWTQRKALLQRPINTRVNETAADLPRSDLFSGGRNVRSGLPKGFFVVNDHSTGRSGKKGGKPRQQSQGRSAKENVAPLGVEKRQQKYRRWGDQLLPQTVNEKGESVPKYEYPAIAPAMPPEIREIWDQLQRECASDK
jgi:tetratricopeptide (TPR) repeat protein